jgi:Ca-activated chloride channel family protein
MIIFLTDGQPTVGDTDENHIVALVSHQGLSAEKRASVRLGDQDTGGPEASGVQAPNTRIFCFGIGHDVNTRLLDRITEATRGYSQYVLPEEDLEVKVSSFYAKIKEPVLTELSLTFPSDVHPTKLYPSPLPDLFKGEQLVVVGRYSHADEGQLVIEGSANGQAKHFSYDVTFPDRAREYDFIPRLWATRRIGYLLDAIRLHGEDKELRDEVTELARRYGVVTPYTAYLIMEDETQRNVPLQVRSLETYDRSPLARREASEAWRGLREDTVGVDATAAARYGLALKSANAAPEAIAQGNREAGRAHYYSVQPQVAPVSPAAGLGGAGPATAMASRPASGPASIATAAPEQQTRYVKGRSFYRNGAQWIDAQVQKMPDAKRIRIQFNSTEYFDLAAKEPQVLPWLALGPNVQFVLGNTVYEVNGADPQADTTGR